MPFLFFLVIIVAVFLFAVVLYNRLVALRNKRENAFADIDVQLRQRHDLVPQLVDTVKGYAKHEKDLLTDITNARSQAMNANSIDEKIMAEKKLGSVLHGLRIAVENYPDLKANQNFMQLQEELSDIENKLAAARRFFNATTTEYNTAVESFPSNLIAQNFNFKREVLFDLEARREEMSEPPKVDFE